MDGTLVSLTGNCNTLDGCPVIGDRVSTVMRGARDSTREPVAEKPAKFGKGLALVGVANGADAHSISFLRKSPIFVVRT